MKNYLAILTAPFVLFGCTYFDPLIKNVDYDPKNLNGSELKHTKKALEGIKVSLDDAIDKRDDNIQTARSLDIATFGLATSAAGYGLRSGHVNAIKNLGFAAGASYIGSTLFASNDTTLTYDKAATSLSCIYVTGESFYTLVNSIKIEESLKGFETCKDKPEYISANRALEVAKRKLEVAKNNDSAIAHDLRSAANKIIESTNSQIIINSPSPTTIFNSAQLASKFINIQPSPKAPDGQSGGAAGAAADVDDCKSDKLALVGLKQIKFNRISNDIDNEINALTSMGETCVLKLPSTNTDLQVLNDEITLSSNEKHILEITGGKPPYKISLKESNSEMSIVNLPISILLLTKTVTKELTLIATVSDSSTATKFKEIKIILKP